MTAEKRAAVELLQMMIDHELNQDYQNADADFISECVDAVLELEGIEPSSDAIERGKSELLKLIKNREMPQDAI